MSWLIPVFQLSWSWGCRAWYMLLTHSLLAQFCCSWILWDLYYSRIWMFVMRSFHSYRFLLMCHLSCLSNLFLDAVLLPPHIIPDGHAGLLASLHESSVLCMPPYLPFALYFGWLCLYCAVVFSPSFTLFMQCTWWANRLGCLSLFTM